jgi:predicted nucleic acid-binding Zn ribbon protein
MQKFSDPPLTACPTCGGPVEKLLSAPAIQFKGTGWYITDYARKSTGAESGKDKGAAGDSATGKAESSASNDKGAARESTSGTARSAEKK